MRKRTKTLVALSLVVGLLAGCGNAKVDEKESGSSAPASSSAAASSEVVESKYPEYLNLDGYSPIVAEGEEITLSMTIAPSTAATTEPEERWFYQYIEQVMNIDLDVDQNWSNERKSILLNSADLPDMMWGANITTGELVTYGQEGGLFLDFNEYISEELTPNIVAAMEQNPAAFEACVSPDGAMYTLPKLGNTNRISGSYRMFVDTEYMEAAGIKELPTTLDEFTDMLRAFKKLDPATMGVDEIHPWIINWHYDWYFLYSAWGWIFDDPGALAKPLWDETEQEVVIPCLQDKFKDYVKYLHMLYQEDLIHDDYFPMSKDQARALIAEGKVAVVSDSTITATQPDRVGEFVTMSPVTSEWTDKPVTSFSSKGYTLGGVVVSADTEYPEVIMRLIDYLYSAEGSAYANAGPVAGSEDELGMIEGVVAGSDGTPKNKPVEDGKFATIWDYQQPYVQLDRQMVLNEMAANAFEYERVGLPVQTTPEEYMATEIKNDNPEYQAWNMFKAQYPYCIKPLDEPYATAEQNERLTDLRTVMENYVDAEMAKFVVGERPIDELDKFMEELWALDGQELWDLGQELYKR